MQVVENLLNKTYTNAEIGVGLGAFTGVTWECYANIAVFVKNRAIECKKNLIHHYSISKQHI